MTLEEALNAIDIAIAEVEWCYPMEYAEAFEMAKEVIEKQIAKKPMKVIKGDKNLPDGFALCPVCRDWVGSTFNYCTKCGQKLDWEINEQSI